jgi:hypothetical protein
MPLYWLVYRHNNSIFVVIEPGASPRRTREIIFERYRWFSIRHSGWSRRCQAGGRTYNADITKVLLSLDIKLSKETTREDLNLCWTFDMAK